MAVTLQVYGHENVSLLNGGLPAWKAAGYPTESGPVRAVERSDYPYALPEKSLIKGMISCELPWSLISYDYSRIATNALIRSMHN